MTRYQRTVEHYRVERCPTANGTRFLVFDLEARVLVRDITDYVGQKKFRTLDDETVAKTTGHIIRVHEFLRRACIDIDEMSDYYLEKFRDWEKVMTRMDKSHRGNPLAVIRTVNAKLESVLPWLTWLNAKRGIQFQGLTLLTPASDGGVPRVRDVCPVYIKKDAKKSQNAVAILPKKAVFDRVVERALTSFQSDYVAKRNSLIARIARQAGPRRESINSLEIGQFNRKEIEASLGTYEVVPPIQKFDYQKVLDLPATLALEVCDFIATYRAQLIASRNDGRDLSMGRIFLAERTAKPLSNGTLSAIFGRLMREAGADKGSALHIFRKEFGSDLAKKESKRRVKAGLDTSTQSVATAVAFKLGQTNPESTKPYVIRQQTELAKEMEAEELQESEALSASLKAAEDANRQLTAEVIALKRELEKHKAGKTN